MAYQPSWGVHEKDLKSDNVDIALNAADAFTETRDIELKISRTARSFEDSRRQTAQKAKHNWVADKRKQEEAELTRGIEELRKGGIFKYGIKAIRPNHVLVKPLVASKTDSGIVLPNSVNLSTTTGVVMLKGADCADFFAEGDKVSFRKGLPGLELSIEGELCLLMDEMGILVTLGDEE